MKKEKRIDELFVCPKCGSSWDGGDIPKEIRQYYSKPYKFSRLIGVEITGKYDGVSEWMCPDCKTRWDRWTNKEVEK